MAPAAGAAAASDAGAADAASFAAGVWAEAGAWDAAAGPAAEDDGCILGVEHDPSTKTAASSNATIRIIFFNLSFFMISPPYGLDLSKSYLLDWSGLPKVPGSAQKFFRACTKNRLFKKTGQLNDKV
jgi:hypothetical protein